MESPETVGVDRVNQDTLFSEHWFRVRDLKPRLANDVVIRRHSYRKVPSYILHRQSTGAYHRVNSSVFKVIDSLDGTTTLDAAWQRAIETQGEYAPTQSELIALLAQLHEAELINVNRRLDAEQLFNRAQDNLHREARQRYLNPLFLRLALFDPDRLLNALRPLAHRLFSRVMLCLWICLVVLALFRLLPRWSDLSQDIQSLELLAAGNLGIFLLIYPLMKLLHELAHGLAVKRFGGEVHELGIALMVFLPLPYVDASAAAALPDKWNRILVSAAGILVELGVASLAALVWSFSGGTLHEIALAVMLIGGVSTLLFNGNPLLKFDGYYVLSDYLEIPNLADRSRQYLSGVAGLQLFGIPDVQGVKPADRAEGYWLIFYGLFSNVYKLTIMLVIAMMLSEKFFFFGVLMALWVLAVMVGLPIYRLLKFIARAPQPSRMRTVMVTSGLTAVIIVIVAFIPMPLNTVSQGVVWLPENAIVRVHSLCEVTETQVLPGATVQTGDSLFYCEDNELETERLVLQAKIEELKAIRAGLELADRVGHGKFGDEIETLQARLEYTNEKIYRQLVKAQSKGQFQTASNTTLVGKYLAPGEFAAYVVPQHERTIRVAIEQVDAAWFRLDETDAELQFAEQVGKRKVYAARVLRQTPKSTTTVTSAGLTTAGGGRIVADPEGDGRTVVEPVFELELMWPDDAPEVNVGSHVSVVFRHAPRPLLSRLIAAAQRAFVGRLDA